MRVFLPMRLLPCCAALLACQPQSQSMCASRPDVVDPCGGADSGVGALPGTPDPGAVPSGTVGGGGGTVDRLWFATTGDTRPAECDQTNAYPKAAIAQIAAAMKTLRVQFTLDLGDHMFVCNQSDAEARQQMGFYMNAIAQGPSTWWMTMGSAVCCAHRSRIGITHRHAASTASRRMKSVASPTITSSSRRSYASGDVPPNVLP